uniref:Heat shock 70 kDa protein 17-like n=1 Tax=Tetraselmis sp. GSL018 TaxID=582737 RepID=A0A061R4B3_9CHLO
MSVIFAVLFSQLNVIVSVAGVAVGVDFGAISTRVAVVMRDGGLPYLHPNALGARSMPSLIGFGDRGERLVGERADMAACISCVFHGARDLLGLPATAMTRAWGYAFFKYNLTTVPERRTPLLVSLTGKNFLPEEVGAMLLKEAVKDFAGEAAGQAGGPRVAVAVPPQWTQRRRQALIDACNIAGLNLTSIISDHAAAALQYGVEQPLRKGERRRTVLIVGLGATSGYAAIVRYSAYTAKVNPGGRGRPSAAVSVPYIAVKRIAWEEGVGGWHMDALLAKHLAGQAEAGGACSAAPSPAGGCIGPRAMSRLLAAARKAREVLSVNTEAAAQVTDLVPGRDFSTTVTRAQFEDLAREIVERAAKPAARVLRSYPAGIDAIELVGGASRTPLFQALLRQAVSAATGRDLPLGRHVNTDEAVALGAALRAANVTAAVKDGRAPPRAALQDISPFTLGGRRQRRARPRRRRHPGLEDRFHRQRHARP